MDLIQQAFFGILEPALIEEIDGKMQWRYLQETFLA